MLVGVDHIVPVEVGTSIVPRVSKRPAKGVLQDVEVARVHHVVIVGIARPHQPQLHVRNRGP